MRVTLKQLRMLNDLTQQDTADKIGVNVGTWINWENQKTFPDARKIAKIEEVFDIHYDDIIFFNINHGLTVKDKQEV